MHRECHLSKDLKEMRKPAVWWSGLRMFQAEGIASAQTLRWGVPGRWQGAQDSG